MDNLYALSVNVPIALATQQHLYYHCKALFETPCINNDVSLHSF
jgi:hypothetical protein